MTNTFNRNDFGKKLKHLRKNKGMTQTQLSESTGFSQNTISNWENGNREPETINDLLKISQFFNVSVNYFVEERDTYGDHKANLDHLADKPELLQIYNEIYESENLQLLFDTARDLTPDELEAVLNVIKMIHKGE